MKVFPFDMYSGEYENLMKKLEVSTSGKEIMKNRFSMRTFMITDISTPAANVVKQHVLALGGEAAVPSHSVNCGEPKSDLIFSVREDKLPNLLNKFKAQCWKLPIVASRIEELLSKKSPWFDFKMEGLSSDRPAIMGILNVTPDSFSDGGEFNTLESAVLHAEKMIVEGADIIDVGGESTRPGAKPVDAAEEIERTVPVITEIIKKYPEAIISIDTSKSEVAKAAVKAGAKIVNDISGLNFDENMAQVCADLDVPVILMHILGEPRTMQKDPNYENLLLDVSNYLETSVEKAVSAGIKKENLMIDPGIGFGKKLEHILTLIKHLEVFHIFSLPILVGLSRKSMIGAVTGRTAAQDREAGTTAFHMKVLEKNAAILRVHDVAAAKDSLAVHIALKESQCF